MAPRWGARVLLWSQEGSQPGAELSVEGRVEWSTYADQLGLASMGLEHLDKCSSGDRIFWKEGLAGSPGSQHLKWLSER